MKLALLFLLGALALTANAKYFDDLSDADLSQIATFNDEAQKPGIFDGIRDRVQKKVRELSKTYIQFLENQLAALVNKFIAQISSLAQYSLYSVDKKARDARTEFLLSNDEHSLPCFNEYRSKFDSVQSSAKAGVDDCTFNATLEINAVRKNVRQHIDAIEEKVEQFNDILKECINIFNPFSTTKCLFKNASNLTASIKDIVSSAMDTIKVGGENLKKVVSGTNECIKSNAKKAEQQTNIMIDDIKKCIDKAHDATTEVPTTEPPSKPPTAAPSTPVTVPSIDKPPVVPSAPTESSTGSSSGSSIGSGSGSGSGSSTGPSKGSAGDI